jgi:hypothetical protein
MASARDGTYGAAALGRDPGVNVADSDRLEADMVPVTTSDDVGPTRGKAVPL